MVRAQSFLTDSNSSSVQRSRYGMLELEGEKTIGQNRSGSDKESRETIISNPNESCVTKTTVVLLGQQRLSRGLQPLIEMLSLSDFYRGT